MTTIGLKRGSVLRQKGSLSVYNRAIRVSRIAATSAQNSVTVPEETPPAGSDRASERLRLLFRPRDHGPLFFRPVVSPDEQETHYAVKGQVAKEL